jgi:hypothetical protein
VKSINIHEGLASTRSLLFLPLFYPFLHDHLSLFSLVYCTVLSAPGELSFSSLFSHYLSSPFVLNSSPLSLASSLLLTHHSSLSLPLLLLLLVHPLLLLLFLPPLQMSIRRMDEEALSQRKEYDLVINERDILGTQLIRRNDELALLNEKVPTHTHAYTRIHVLAYMHTHSCRQTHV